MTDDARVADFRRPNDPVLDGVWGQLAEAGIPVVTHCGSGPVPGACTGPEPIAALLARHPRTRLRPSNRSASARRGCARSATTMPPRCLASDPLRAAAPLAKVVA